MQGIKPHSHTHTQTCIFTQRAVVFSAKQNCVPERKKWCLKRKRFVGEIKKVNLD